MSPWARRVSVVIPARNEARNLGETVRAVLSQGTGGFELEVLVVDDGSTDLTDRVARTAGARVLRRNTGARGNPAAARNLGAAAATGDPIVFLDADCTPVPGWLQSLLSAHEAGEVVVGGALDLPPGLPASARCDYYSAWYHAHSQRPRGYVPNHPPGNLSVRRSAFAATSGFEDDSAVAYAHEELRWQSELAARGIRIYFEPAAVVLHHSRPGISNLLRRSYRWGYSAIDAKRRTRAARGAWAYGSPWLLILASLPLALPATAYTLWCWVRAGILEPVWMTPGILAGRCAHAAGMMVGGVRLARRSGAAELRPRWE
jgi:glycosyltransferase involved in cell wall biosynthesis